MKNKLRLGVNIDHVATLRQARGTSYPDPILAAQIATQAGADLITLHLREDRRHIQDVDLLRLKPILTVPMNLEMAATWEMVKIVEKVRPEHCCIVPEKREEKTTEGGLEVAGNQKHIQDICTQLNSLGTCVSLFAAPDLAQIKAAKSCGAQAIELHTGDYANAKNHEDAAKELMRLKEAATAAGALGLIVNAGHGLTLENVKPILELPFLQELNIGHSIIARAIFVGLAEAVREMKDVLVG